ncbi:MAG: pyrimidine-nucleoside phosphorylase [Erysipelotrichaceae bacterium]|nr:MAG: pyrimidine-nucleoside [Erysipelotrichaceae bacterium]TXT17363.1 MAG: pyrimidine-nucleoside phosphorylase [Erysipelotrichaceae bacterium]
MRFLDLIEKKREGFELNEEEIKFWIDGFVAGTIPDYQVSALLMAIIFKGMNAAETTSLTLAMMNSGDILDLSDIKGIKVDKHSTGGVGDKTSLVLGPLVASLGAKVAKMSGRGLGHTGGTVDKLESIKGYNVAISKEDFIKQVDSIGVAIVGQSGNLVPADKKLYALRDVTGTVPSIPLIASSIMSKKLASGADTILLDVKYGDGAFMDTPQQALILTKAMIDIGVMMKRDVRALITDMNLPLGNAVGNALEVKEAIATLNGKGPADLTELCVKAGAVMLIQAKIFDDLDLAEAALIKQLHNGQAISKFIEMVKAQGGDPDQILNPDLLPHSLHLTDIKSDQRGYISSMHTTKLGHLAMVLGAGRATKVDVVNPAVGFVLNKKTGDFVDVGDSLGTIHHDTELKQDWIHEFKEAFVLSDQPIDKVSLIYDRL